MSNTVKALIIAAIVAGAGVVGVMVLGGSDDETNPAPTTSETQTPAADNEPTSTDEEVAATIVYSDNGFSPSSTTITAGQSILFKNESSSDLDLESDPHPAHTSNSELNVGTIPSGESKTVTLGDAGDWGFHNHSNASHQASVEVK